MGWGKRPHISHGLNCGTLSPSASRGWTPPAALRRHDSASVVGMVGGGPRVAGRVPSRWHTRASVYVARRVLPLGAYFGGEMVIGARRRSPVGRP